jgi:hypothetical protein
VWFWAIQAETLLEPPKDSKEPIFLHNPLSIYTKDREGTGLTKSDTAGEVLMRELITYEVEKRRAQISPLRRMEALGVACFSRICDFASRIKSDEEPGRHGHFCDTAMCHAYPTT